MKGYAKALSTHHYEPFLIEGLPLKSKKKTCSIGLVLLTFLYAIVFLRFQGWPHNK